MDKQIYTNGGIVQIASYHTIYPERMLPNLKCVLSKYRREDILHIISNMSNKLANRPFYNPSWSGNQDDIDLPRFCFGINNRDTLYDSIMRYRNYLFYQNNKSGLTATTECAVLYFMRDLMASKEKVINMNTRKFEIDIFKCILTANQLSQPSYSQNPFDERREPELYYASIALAQYGVADIIYTEDKNRVIISQTILCIEFFEWCKTNDTMKPLLKKFCEIYGLGSKWWLYPKSHWGIWAVSHDRVGVVSFYNVKSAEDKIVQGIMELSSIDSHGFIPKKNNRDYKEFRSKPLIKLNEKEYFLFNLTLFFEHIYNSLYFEFNKIASDYFGFKGQQFNNLYTTEFSEKYLLDKCLIEIFANSYDITMTEYDCIQHDRSKDANNCGAPDFYARKNNIVIIVESKDIHLKDTKREFGTISDKVNMMYECFVTSPEGKRKAIRQLLRNAQRIRSGEFQKRWDPYCPNDAIVYPLIVVGDYKFSHPGLKNLLEYWQSQQPENDNNIRPVILSDIATILLYKKQYQNNGFIKYFEDYYRKSDVQPFLKTRQFVDYSNGIASFAAYMQNTETTTMQEYMKKWEGYIRKE